MANREDVLRYAGLSVNFQSIDWKRARQLLDELHRIGDDPTAIIKIYGRMLPYYIDQVTQQLVVQISATDQHEANMAGVNIVGFDNDRYAYICKMV